MENIVTSFTETHPLSKQWHQRACSSLPNGVTHDLRDLKPFPLYVSRAKGSRKWDLSIGVVPPFDIPTSPAVLEEIRNSTVVVPPDDLNILESVLRQDGDIAGLIMEATGGSSGTYPMFAETLRL